SAVSRASSCSSAPKPVRRETQRPKHPARSRIGQTALDSSAGGRMAEPLKRLFTRDEYYAMAEAGILKPEDRLELIEGEIYRMPPIGTRHAGCVNRLVDGFAALLSGRRAVLSPQNPVNLTDISEPQSDVTLLRPRADFYGEGHPTPDDVLLVVEVAD